MRYEFVPMTVNYADEMMGWQYNGVMKNIYVEPYFKSFEETGIIKGPGGCDGFAVLSENKLIGLFEYYLKDGIMEIGLALSPEFVGKGLGKEFVIQGINFGVDYFKYDHEWITLNVNIENKPAIRVYEKVGFIKYKKDSDGIEMRYYLANQMKQCPFCWPEVEKEAVLVSTHNVYIKTPSDVLQGSGMIVPKKHRETVFDLSKEEFLDTYQLLNQVKEMLDKELNPDGYNVGWNCYAVGGQTVPHAHLHIIPRFKDEPLAGKGIRHHLKQENNLRESLK